MARLARIEDSDDDFPALADVIRKHGKPDQGSGDENIRGILHRGPRCRDSASSNAKRMSDSNAYISDEDMPKPKPRRRILNKKCDNPLLRRLDDGTNKMAVSSLSKTLKLRSSTVSKRVIYTKKNAVGATGSSEEEESLDSDSTGLSDFIVRDSSFLDNEVSDDDLKSRTRASRPTRKLIRGRRPSRQASSISDTSDDLPGTNDGKSVGYIPVETRKLPESECIGLSDDSDRDGTTRRQVKTEVRSKSRDRTSSFSVDETFPILSFSPPRKKSPHKIDRNRSGTPPSGPQKHQAGLVSPKKIPRIPSTPHRPSTDAFWSQNVVNEWNDEYSPRKIPEAAPKQLPYSKVEGDLLAEPFRKKSYVNQSRSVLEAKKSFAAKKHQIAETFLKEVDDAISGGKVSEMTASTGGIKIIWSKKLNTTAGRANWRRESVKQQSLGPQQIITYRHHASIELAEKVIDDENRLLNVLAHEFCHLANFMVSGIKTNPHGKEFKSWAAKCSRHFGHRDIEVTTKHSYVIDYKYIWECTNCGMEFKRHSKSIDPAKHQCGSCKSKLVQIRPIVKGTGMLSEYQTFMKENMRKIKEDNPGSPHKEIMGLVGKKYQEYKATKDSTVDKKGNVDTRVEEVIASREETPADVTVDAVVRKLNFLDLTSL